MKDRNVFKRIRLADLRQGRRGRHHEAVMHIIQELSGLPDGEAIVVPAKTFNITLANLRSALMRATASRHIEIATYSEGSTLYVWRKTAASSKYERAANQAPAGRKAKSS
jgi:hypothetical protein